MSADSLGSFSVSMTMSGGNLVLLPNQARPASCLSQQQFQQQHQQQQIQRL